MLKNIHHHMFSDQIFGKKINDIAEIFITLVTKFKKQINIRHVIGV